MKVCAQILVENSSTNEIQALELVDNFTNTDDSLISQLLLESFREMPEVEVGYVQYNSKFEFFKKRRRTF